MRTGITVLSIMRAYPSALRRMGNAMYLAQCMNRDSGRLVRYACERPP